MSYVIYNIETTMLYKGSSAWPKRYKTLPAAKAAMTRGLLTADKFAIADERNFHKNIEKQVTVRSLMNSAPVVQPANTPRCCDPSSELYWSM